MLCQREPERYRGVLALSDWALDVDGEAVASTEWTAPWMALCRCKKASRQREHEYCVLAYTATYNLSLIHI